MQYKATLRVAVSGKHTLEQLKTRLQDQVYLDLEEQDSDGIRVEAIEIDWETLEKDKSGAKTC
jgi:hypothetical protein